MLTKPTTSIPALKPLALPNSCTLAERDLAAAYSDWHEHHASSYIPERNLNFCSPVTVSLAEARRLLSQYVSSYNEFAPKLLQTLPATCRVRLARESSVCLYIETKEAFDEAKIRLETRCDEFDLCQVLGRVRTYRLWWD